MYTPITRGADGQVRRRDRVAPARPRPRRADRDGLHRFGPARRESGCWTAGRVRATGRTGRCSSEAYPRVRFRPEKVLELAHEADGLITGGGVTAWQDLALLPDRPVLRAGARGRDGQGLPARPPRRGPAAVLGDDARSSAATTRRSAGRSNGSRRTMPGGNPVSSMAEEPGSIRGRSPGGSRPRRAGGRSSTSTSCAWRRRAGCSRREPPPSTTSAIRWGTRTRRSSAACSGARRA